MTLSLEKIAEDRNHQCRYKAENDECKDEHLTSLLSVVPTPLRRKLLGISRVAGKSSALPWRGRGVAVVREPEWRHLEP